MLDTRGNAMLCGHSTLNEYDQNRNKYQFVELLKNDLDQLVHNGWVENQGHDVAKYP